MCLTCWEDRGCPRLISPKVVHAAKLVERVYDHSCVGGQLHIQLDDWNIDDDFWTDEDHPTRMPCASEYDPEAMAAFVECFDVMRHMTLAERASAIAYADGYFEFDPDVAANKCDACMPERL